jgi:hypothetical protein
MKPPDLIEQPSLDSCEAGLEYLVDIDLLGGDLPEEPFAIVGQASVSSIAA